VGLRAGVQDEALREGHGSYALKQAAYLDGMRARFQAQWEGLAGLVENARAACAETRADEEGESNEGSEERAGPTDLSD
jgi:hypothetical protein